MSIFDIIGSIGWAFSTAPIPQGSNCAYGAIGNEATCATQGFMLTLGLIVPWYNAMLCIYYLLVVKYNVRDEVIARYEPLMHLISICPTLTVAIVAAANDLLNNFSSICCWVQHRDHYEPNHDHEPSTILFAIYSASAISTALILLTIGYCMICLYTFVKNQQVKMNTYQFQRPDNIDSSSGNTIFRRRSDFSRLSNDVIDTKKQAFLYVGSFVLTYFFTNVCLVLDIIQIKAPYPVILMQGISAPLAELSES